MVVFPNLISFYSLNFVDTQQNDSLLYNSTYYVDLCGKSTTSPCPRANNSALCLAVRSTGRIVAIGNRSQYTISSPQRI